MSRKGGETAKVILARQPDSGIVKKIAAFTESRGCTNIKYIIDPCIIGGIIIYIGDTIYDGSVRSRIDHIKQSI